MPACLYVLCLDEMTLAQRTGLGLDRLRGVYQFLAVRRATTALTSAPLRPPCTAHPDVRLVSAGGFAFRKDGFTVASRIGVQEICIVSWA